MLSAQASARPWEIGHLESIEAAARRMRDTGQHTLFVVRDGKLIGVLTDRDIVVRFVTEGGESWLARVTDFMTSSPIVCRREDDPDEVLERMASIKARSLPIVDSEGHLIGVCSREQLQRNRFGHPSIAAVGPSIAA